ncbi:MAG: hypothetical protein NT133_16555, partial [Alphaproteobacteria bacterium]|nr:hypothetical protein [Alphaproteobacteria bacterium]
MAIETVLGGGLPKMPGMDSAAVKAVRDSFVGKWLGRWAVLVGIIVLVLGTTQGANLALQNFGLVLPWPLLHNTLLFGLPALVIALQLANEWNAARNRKAAMDLAIKPAAVPTGYFRIAPYLATDKDRKAFGRADQAHVRALGWLSDADTTPLYLTGDSGAGKSSLLNAFVLPAMLAQGWVISPVRAGADAEAALRTALGATDGTASLREALEGAVARANGKLLLVLDQFEEFIILGTPERHAGFAALVNDLGQRPLAGLKLLLVLRSDYQTGLDDIGLPKLMQGFNFFQVGRFNEVAARGFVKGSKLGLKDEALDRLVKSAAEYDGTPGLVRPITLNMLGHVLTTRGGSVVTSLEANRLVRDYVAQAVDNPAIRAWAPRVLAGLLTEEGTKRARPEAELAAEAKLRPAEARAVLIALAEAALARPLEATQSVWELSHDFVARAVATYLGRRRAMALRTLASYAAPLVLLIGIVLGGGVIVWNHFAPGQAVAELFRLGISIGRDAEGMTASATSEFRAENLTAAVQLLAKFPITRLSLDGTSVSDLSPLQG